MKRIFTFSTIIIFSLSVFSQPLTYSKVIYDSLGFAVQSNSVVQAFDGGYVIAGTAWEKGIVIKIDSAGNLLWNRTFDLNGSFFPNAVFTHIIAANDSNYIICGSIPDTVSMQIDGLCFKMDSNGNILWIRSIHQVGYTLEMDHVEQTTDSGYIMTGYAYQNPTPSTRIFVAKLDAAGNLQWKNLLTGGNNANYGISVKQVPDSGYFLAGYIEDCFSNCNGYAALIKLDSTGTVSWAKKFYTPSGNFVFLKDFESEDNGFLFYVATSSSGYNSALMKTDFSGNILWSKEYQFPAGNCMNCHDTKLRKTTDGGSVLVNGGGVLKTDSSGNVLFSSNLFLITSDVIESYDKGYFISGNGPLIGVMAPRVFWPQIGIIKTDSMGFNNTMCVFSNFVSHDTIVMNSSSANFTSITNAVPGTILLYADSLMLVSHLGCVDFLGNVAENNFDNTLSLSPNPASSELVVRSSEFGDKKIELVEVYDVMGQRVFSQQPTANSQQLTIDVSYLPDGVYFICIRDDKHRESKAKFVKLR